MRNKPRKLWNRGPLASSIFDYRRPEPLTDWLGDDEGGQPVASGVYMYVLKTEREARSQKVALLR